MATDVLLFLVPFKVHGVGIKLHTHECFGCVCVSVLIHVSTSGGQRILPGVVLWPSLHVYEAVSH